MSEEKKTELEILVKDYLSNNNILIVDSVSSARVSLAAGLTKLGAIRNKMALVGSLEEAREELKKKDYKVIFSDFMFGNQSGLDLIQDQKAKFEKSKIKDNLFVLVTANASQSTVARAAEEDVDTFVIKPYSMTNFTKAISFAIKEKLRPSLYIQLIDQGKEKLISGEFDLAIEIFTKAKSEHPQPTLACFYLGQAEQMKAAIEGAVDQYSEGLGYNKIHYKCLTGLYDILMSQKKYHESYDVVKRVAQYFPSNPKRLASVLRLAIITENFDDIESYYAIFQKIDQRMEELIRYMCSALVVTGKHYLKRQIRTRAMSLFENAAVSAAGRTQFLLYVIENLVEFKMQKESFTFLKRLTDVAPASKDNLAATFLVSTFDEAKLIDSIHLGRTALKAEAYFPAVYQKLILQSLKGGYRDAAEELSQEAVKRWPDKKDMFTIIDSRDAVSA